MLTTDDVIALKELLNEAKCHEIRGRRIADRAAELSQKAEIAYSEVCQNVRDLEAKLEESLKELNKKSFFERFFNN